MADLILPATNFAESVKIYLKRKYFAKTRVLTTKYAHSFYQKNDNTLIEFPHANFDNSI